MIFFEKSHFVNFVLQYCIAIILVIIIINNSSSCIYISIRKHENFRTFLKREKVSKETSLERYC